MENDAFKIVKKIIDFPNSNYPNLEFSNLELYCVIDY